MCHVSNGVILRQRGLPALLGPVGYAKTVVVEMSDAAARLDSPHAKLRFLDIEKKPVVKGPLASNEFTADRHCTSNNSVD
jgi:hypothetical protein